VSFRRHFAPLLVSVFERDAKWQGLRPVFRIARVHVEDDPNRHCGPRSICRSKSEVVVAQVAQLAFSSVNGPLKPLGMMCSWLVPGEPQ